MCIAAALLALGCKKESKTATAKTYLVSQITYVVTYANNSQSTYVDQYTYDSQNRVTTFNSQRIGVNFKYTYNSNNSLATVTATYPNGSNYYVSTYTYSGSTIRDSVNVLNGYNTNINLLTLNAKGQVATYNLNGQASDFSYTYDNSGNVVDFRNMSGQNDQYTYDNKKSPFSMLGAPNLEMMYFMNTTPQTNVNNPLSTDNGPTTYAYTYNSAGFPIIATVVVNNAMQPLNYTMAYEYITK